MRNQAGGHHRRGPRPRDHGVTFVEILITIVLMGTVVLGVLTATRSLIRASHTSSEVATLQSALLTAAERIERAPREQYQCVFDEPVDAAAQLKLGVSEGESEDYWDLGYEHLTQTGWVDGACPAGGYQPHLVQRIRITMTSPSTDVTRSLVVIRSDV